MRQQSNAPAGGPLPEDVFQPLPRRQVVLTMAGVLLAMFLASLDQTIVGTAMPRIIADLGGFSQYTWVATAYLVASTAAVPVIGRLTDIYGRKWFFTGGIAVFLVGSMLCGFSQNMAQLIAARAFQGLGAGVMMANSFVAIADLFPPNERAKYGGLLGGVFGLSSVIGPALGGFITDTLSWHWVFFVNLVPGIPVVALFVGYFPHIRRNTRKQTIDFAGAGLLTFMLISLLLGLSWGGREYPWNSWQILGTLGASAVSLVAFIWTERRVKDPILPLSLFQNRVVSISLLAILITGFGMFGAIIFIPLFFQGVLGASATSSGSFVTPMSMGMIAGAALSGQILSRTGGHYRIQGLFGLAIMAVGVFLLTRMNASTTFGQAVFNIVVMGFGLGTTFPLFTIAVQNSVSFRFMGVATSTTQIARSVGGTVGLAVLGSYMAGQFSANLAASIPPEVARVIPADRLAQLGANPQALLNPNALSGMQAAFGQAGAAVAAQLLQAVRHALATSLSHVFMVTLGVILLAFVVTLFLPEVKLQGRARAGGRGGRPQPAAPPEGV